MNSFENNLKRLRNRQNMKQDDLAERMNVSRQTISGWETGRRQPDLDTLKNLAEVLDVDIHELIYGNKPGEYPRFQKKHVIWTAVCGGLVTALLLFWLLIWPYFKVMCATFYWGLLLTICYLFLPQVGSFAFGSLIPALIQLFIPIHMKKKWAVWCLISSMIIILPVILFWLSISPWSRWILYPVGKAFLAYILPVISGVFLTLGATYKTAC